MVIAGLRCGLKGLAARPAWTSLAADWDLRCDRFL